MEEQLALINRFAFMPLKGPVCVTKPNVTFSVLFDRDIHGTVKRAYFGRRVAQGARGLIGQFNLKTRDYLGTTSMDAELSLMMCNMAGIREGSLVYDPFVGTGSFLCTAGYFGGVTLGSDIDGRQMRGREGKSLHTNLAQYGVAKRLCDALVFDIRQHPWRKDIRFDAIMTDPPYGVRAGAKKIGAKWPDTPNAVCGLTKEERANRYPKTVPYEMDELAKDLHQFAHQFLRVGGRLVYWHPVEFGGDKRRLNEQEVREVLPLTEGLRLIAVIGQQCRLFDRWLVVLERT